MARKLGDDSSKIAKEEAEAEARSNLTQPAFLDAVRQMAAMDEKVAGLRAQRTALRKKLKAEGIELGVLDAVMKMADWGRNEQRENFKRRQQYAAWLGLAVGHQGELFKDGMSDKEREAAEWHAAGRTACYTGKPAVPPEECPPIHHQDFMKGWHEADSQEWDDAAPATKSEAKPETKAEKKDKGKPAKPADKPTPADLPEMKKAAAEKQAAANKAAAETPARDAVRDAVSSVAAKKAQAKAKARETARAEKQAAAASAGDDDAGAEDSPALH